MQIAIDEADEDRMTYCQLCGRALPTRTDEYKIEDKADKDKYKIVCAECFYAHYRAERLKLTPRP